MTDSMNSAEQGRRPSSSLPQNQELAPAGGPSLSPKDSSVAARFRSALDNASDPKFSQVDMAVRHGGGTLPGVGQGGRRRGRSGETSSAEEGGRPPTSSRRDFLIAMGLVAAATVATGGVEAKTGFIRKLFGRGKKEGNVVVPPVTPDVPKNTATATSTEAPATATSTAEATATPESIADLPGAKGQHESIDKMPLSEKKKARIKEILARENASAEILTDGSVVAITEGLKTRTKFMGEGATSMDGAILNVADFKDSAQRLDQVGKLGYEQVMKGNGIYQAYDADTGVVKKITVPQNPTWFYVYGDQAPVPGDKEQLLYRPQNVEGQIFRYYPGEDGESGIMLMKIFSKDLIGHNLSAQSERYTTLGKITSGHAMPAMMALGGSVILDGSTTGSYNVYSGNADEYNKLQKPLLEVGIPDFAEGERNSIMRANGEYHYTTTAGAPIPHTNYK